MEIINIKIDHKIRNNKLFNSDNFAVIKNEIIT